MTAMLSVEAYVAGILGGERQILARAITLVESRLEKHRETAEKVLQALHSHCGNALRIGISGVPGVGKSTFIETLGLKLTEEGHKIAVLAVDPSSSVGGGSILGDKTRMQSLARQPAAFIRPSPSGGRLGGVAATTREAMLCCEAAGFTVILVETVGVGQSEAAVAELVDLFMLLLLPGAGDDLQGIKRGALELANLVVVNKADGNNLAAANLARRDYEAALRLTRPVASVPPVVLCSALQGSGMTALWQTVKQLEHQARSSGEFQEKRRNQQTGWLWSHVEESLLNWFRTNPAVQRRLDEALHSVNSGQELAPVAAKRLLALLQTERFPPVGDEK